jgi:hypothetical protein
MERSALHRAAFRQAMQELGRTEGKNIEYRFVVASGDMDRPDDPAWGEFTEAHVLPGLRKAGIPEK